MSGHGHAALGTDERVMLGPAGMRVARIGAVVGVAALLGSLGLGIATGDGMARFMQSWLVAYAFWLSITLGALFFVTLQHLTRAGWSVVIRRVAEGMSMNVFLMLVLFLPILLAGMPTLYDWARPGIAETDFLIKHKEPYLNLPFFALRWVIYFFLWIVYTLYFFRGSRRQDATGEKHLTIEMQRNATHGMAVFAATITFAAFDLLMSLDAHWFSTIFGVYYFAGSVIGVFSSLILAAWLLQSSGRLARSVTTEHYHDLGRFLFGFTVFWAYIAFSQYMLIWVADIPEETGWILRRQEGGWGILSLVLIFGHFFGPFLILIHRSVKRRPALLAAMAVWMLLMHWADLYWLAMPEFADHAAHGDHAVEAAHAASPALPLHAMDATLMIAFGALFVAGTAFALRNAPLLPEKDPRLSESLALDNA